MTSDVLPIHALLSIWQSQVENRKDDFKILADELDAERVAEATLLAVNHLIGRMGLTDSIEHFATIVETGRRTLRVANSWEMAGIGSVSTVEAARDLGIGLVLAPEYVPEGLQTSLMLRRMDVLPMVMAACIPLNLLGAEIMAREEIEHEQLFKTVRAEFWGIENHHHSA